MSERYGGSGGNVTDQLDRTSTPSGGIDWPQVRDMFAEREAAKELAEKERRKALQLQREADNQRLTDLEKFLLEALEGKFKLLSSEAKAAQERVELALSASEKAIEKEERTTGVRFEAVNEAIGQLRSNETKFVTRELYRQLEADTNRRLELHASIVQELSIRLTGMEARGTGGKDYAADLKATLAIGVAIVFGILSVATILLINFAG